MVWWGGGGREKRLLRLCDPGSGLRTIHKEEEKYAEDGWGKKMRPAGLLCSAWLCTYEGRNVKFGSILCAHMSESLETRGFSLFAGLS